MNAPIITHRSFGSHAPLPVRSRHAQSVAPRRLALAEAILPSAAPSAAKDIVVDLEWALAQGSYTGVASLDEVCEGLEAGHRVRVLWPEPETWALCPELSPVDALVRLMTCSDEVSREGAVLTLEASERGLDPRVFLAARASLGRTFPAAMGTEGERSVAVEIPILGEEAAMRLGKRAAAPGRMLAAAGVLHGAGYLVRLDLRMGSRFAGWQEDQADVVQMACQMVPALAGDLEGRRFPAIRASAQEEFRADEPNRESHKHRRPGRSSTARKHAKG